MPEQNTGADALRMYLTGASSHEGVQADPDLSLGNFRSQTSVAGIGFAVTSPIANVSVIRAARKNGEGAGTLTATGANTLAWTPPGGSQGPSVTISNGETKMLLGGGDDNKYLVVSRTSATALAGAATVTLSLNKEGAISKDDLSTAEQSAGATRYRCVAIKNESGGSVANIKAKLAKLGTQQTSDTGQLGGAGAGTVETSGSFADWPNSGYAAIKTSGGSLREVIYYSSRTATELTVPAAGRALQGTSAGAGASDDTVDAIPGMSLALDAPSSQPSGNFEDETGTGETTSPGFTFNTVLEDAEALSVGTLAAGEQYGIWIKHESPAGVTGGTDFESGLELLFDAA